MASGKLSELQHQEVSVEADLDAKAPLHRVLDFLEEVLLTAASGEPSEEALLTTARRLLGATGGILDILDTLRSLVSDSDIGGTVQRKCEPAVDSGVESAWEEAAFLAHRSRRRHRFPSLIRDGGLSRDTCVVGGTSSLGGRGLHGLSLQGVAGGQVLLWPEEVLCPGGWYGGSAAARRGYRYCGTPTSAGGRYPGCGGLYACFAAGQRPGPGGFAFPGPYPGRDRYKQRSLVGQESEGPFATWG